MIGANTMPTSLFHESDTAWIIEQIVPVLTALIAVLMAYWGFQKSYRNIEKDHKHEFQIRTYEKILEAISLVTNQSSSYIAFLSSFSSQLTINFSSQEIGLLPTDLGSRPKDYIHRHHQYSQSITNLMMNLETIQIIEPKLKIFCTALSSINWEVGNYRDQITDDTFSYVFNEFINRDGKEIKANPALITASDMKRIQDTINNMCNSAIDGMCYIEDLKVELQNLLLGEVYSNRKLALRTPLVAGKKVISIERYDELKKYFREQHPMGIEQDRLEKEIRGNL